jgi:tetratricopeptide (TPR) repeat protein
VTPFSRVVLISSLFVSGAVVAQQAQSPNACTERARREFLDHEYAAAERDFRELTKVDPSNLFAHAYLGHTLFRQEKYAEAIAPYEKALELERSTVKLSVKDHRVLVDQLVMSYGMSGQLKKAHELLDDAIKQDTQYPLNYYNRACTFAEEGDKGNMLTNLALAFQHKAHVLEGEKMPDPRLDPSFEKYLRDPDFVSLMKKQGYQ